MAEPRCFVTGCQETWFSAKEVEGRNRYYCRKHGREADLHDEADEHISEASEASILEVRMKAALMEQEAASIRLDTAKAEAKSAKRTLAMADQVAQSMFNRERQGGLA